MDKRLKIEGSAASKMVQLMRKHGYNKDIGIEIGKVTSPLPNLSIMLNDGIELDRNDLIVSQTVNNANLAAGDSVIIIADDDSQSYFVIDKAVI